MLAAGETFARLANVQHKPYCSATPPLAARSCLELLPGVLPCRAPPAEILLPRAAKLFARAQDSEVKLRLLENTQSAVERGAFGVPTYFVGNEMFFGKD